MNSTSTPSILARNRAVWAALAILALGLAATLAMSVAGVLSAGTPGAGGPSMLHPFSVFGHVCGAAFAVFLVAQWLHVRALQAELKEFDPEQALEESDPDDDTTLPWPTRACLEVRRQFTPRMLLQERLDKVQRREDQWRHEIDRVWWTWCFLPLLFVVTPAWLAGMNTHGLYSGQSAVVIFVAVLETLVLFAFSSYLRSQWETIITSWRQAVEAVLHGREDTAQEMARVNAEKEKIAVETDTAAKVKEDPPENNGEEPPETLPGPRNTGTEVSPVAKDKEKKKAEAPTDGDDPATEANSMLDMLRDTFGD